MKSSKKISFKLRRQAALPPPTTDEAYLQDEEDPKSMAPPPTAQTAGPIGLILPLGVHQRHRIGVTVAIFEFPSQTL